MGNKGVLTAVVIVLVIVLIAVAYRRGWLNRFLPASWREKAHFVGAYGRTPEMQGCLAFPDPSKRWTNFNRCTWV
jgi:hypothetical protein